MKKLTILKMIAALAIMFLGHANSWGQSTTPPVNFKPHGTNSADVVTPKENIDTLVVGAVMDYWIMPSSGATLTTTWTWSRPTGTATVTGVPTGQTAEFTFPASPETGTIKSVETTNSCPDPTGTTINYAVVAKPSVGFSDATPATSIGLCNFTSAQTLNIALTSATAGANEDMNVTYTVSKGGTQIGTSHTQMLKRSNTTIVIPFAEFGATPTAGVYTVTFSNVDDRIVRKAKNKASIIGTINTATYTITITAVPTTGPIYHLPNM
jgi:hypothetical protein